MFWTKAVLVSATLALAQISAATALVTIQGSDVEYDDDGGVVDLGQVDGVSTLFSGWAQTSPFQAGNSFVSDSAAANGVSSLIASSNGEVLMLRHIHPATGGIGIRNFLSASQRPAGMTVSVDVHYTNPVTVATLHVGGISVTMSNSFGVDYSDNTSAFNTIAGLSPDSPVRISLLYNGDGTADLTFTRLTDNTVFSFPDRILSLTSYNLFLFQFEDGDQTSVLAVNNITASIPNSAPTNITLPSPSVSENSPIGTPVGTLSTSDVDNPAPGQTHSYTLVSGSGDTNNSNFTIVGNEVRVGAVLDFEAGATRSIRVRSTDNGSPPLSFEKEFIIPVVDQNEAPTGLALAPQSVAENLPTNSLVGALSANDPDAGQSLTYSLVPGFGSTDNARFTIASGELRTAQTFDFEAGTLYSIRVQVEDNGSPPLNAVEVLQVSVSDVNETPTLVAGTTTWTVPDDVTTTLTAVQLEATDAESGPSGLQYTVLAIPSSGVLKRNGTPLLNGATFTQQDVNSGLIVFTANPGSATDALQYELRDAGSILLGPFTLPITIDAGSSFRDWELITSE